jgi:hypothetical protein
MGDGLTVRALGRLPAAIVRGMMTITTITRARS